LRDHECNIVLTMDGVKRRNRKVGSTEEHEPHERILWRYVVVGGVSGSVVVDGCAGGVAGSYGPAVPSTPVVGCGGACPEGVALSLCGGFETAGGWFW